MVAAGLRFGTKRDTSLKFLYEAMLNIGGLRLMTAQKLAARNIAAINVHQWSGSLGRITGRVYIEAGIVRSWCFALILSGLATGN